MHCFDARRFIPAFVDGEFDERDRGEFEAHLRACRDCRTAARFEAWFVEGVRRAMPKTPAPPGLRDRILAQLSDVPMPLSQRLAGAIPRPAWVAVPALVAAALALVLLFRQGPDPAGVCAPPLEAAVAVHRRHLPAEVIGSDPQAAGRWFDGKLDFPVHPLADPADFVGARLSSVGQFPAAHFMYDLHGSPVSVMAFKGQLNDLPADEVRTVGPFDVRLTRRDGYNVALYEDGGVTYAVTGDVDPSEMVRFVSHGMR